MAATGNAFDNEPLKPRAVFISWRWLSLTFALIIVLLGAILIAYGPNGSDVDSGTRALIGAFSKQRLIEPRLSGGFKGGRFNPAGDGTSDVGTEEFKQAQVLIADAAARNDPGAELAYGRLLLSKGESEKLPEAQKYLHRAVAGSPQNAETHNLSNLP